MMMYESIIAPPSIEGNEGKNLTVIDTMGLGLVLHSYNSRFKLLKSHKFHGSA